MAAVSDAWDYVIDEAAVAEAAPQLAAAKPNIDVAVTSALAGMLQCFAGCTLASPCSA